MYRSLRSRIRALRRASADDSFGALLVARPQRLELDAAMLALPRLYRPTANAE